MARVVAADLGGAANDLLDGLSFTRAGHSSLFQFTLFAALEGFFQIVD